MQAEEGLVRSIRDEAPGVGQVGCTALPGLRVAQYQPCRLRAVELARPRRAAVAAVQHDAVVPHGPALRRGRELHRGQRHADGDAGLAPGGAVVVGQHDDAALAHGHEALARAGDAGEVRPGRLRRHGRGTCQPVGDGRRRCRAGRGAHERGRDNQCQSVQVHETLHDANQETCTPGGHAAARPARRGGRRMTGSGPGCRPARAGRRCGLRTQRGRISGRRCSENPARRSFRDSAARPCTGTASRS